MNRTLHIVVGLVAVGAGSILFATYAGAFNEHYQIQAHPIDTGGFITDVKMIEGNTELHYRFREPDGREFYTGLSVFQGTQYKNLSVGVLTPVQYAEGNPEINRHQLAREEIYTLGRNVAVGAFLVVIGLAVITRGFQSSGLPITPELVEVVEVES